MSANNHQLDRMTADLLRPVNFTGKGFKLWAAFLLVSLAVCTYAYITQLKEGLGVTGMRDYISWGMYLSNFVFFVAASLIGMLLTAVLGLLGMRWAHTLSRIAEIIALAFASVSGLVIVSDMGRPDRLLNVFMYGRIQSPILWDVTVVTTYCTLSMLLLYLPLIPDLRIAASRMESKPKWVKAIYNFLSIKWIDNEEQRSILKRSIRVLTILIVPVALAIHTVTSWLFASTSRTGWDSTLFGPYFVVGAFVAGCGAVIIAMFIYRRAYNLKEYITEMHFDNMSKLLVLVSLVYLYFNLNEFLVPAYKMKRVDAMGLHDLFAGRFALMFWTVQIGGLVLPIILLLFKKMRKPTPSMIISIAVVLGAWFKRYIIVVPTMESPNLPIQNVPENFKFYSPTLTETAVTMASFILVLIIITVLSKLFPIIPIAEIEDHDENK